MARGPARDAEPLIQVRRVFVTRTGSPLRSKTLARKKHQPACKPGSGGHRLACARAIRDGHSSGTMFAHRLEQPTRTASLTWPCGVIALRRTARVAVPIRFCSRWGLPCRLRCRTRGALLPHLFTLTAPTPRGAKAGGSFSVALSLGSPPPDVIRHRMSMEPGLSSPAAFRHLPERPSGRLTGQACGLQRATSSDITHDDRQNNLS